MKGFETFLRRKHSEIPPENNCRRIRLALLRRGATYSSDKRQPCLGWHMPTTTTYPAGLATFRRPTIFENSMHLTFGNHPPPPTSEDTWRRRWGSWWSDSSSHLRHPHASRRLPDSFRSRPVRSTEHCSLTLFLPTLAPPFFLESNLPALLTSRTERVLGRPDVTPPMFTGIFPTSLGIRMSASHFFMSHGVTHSFARIASAHDSICLKCQKWHKAPLEIWEIWVRATCHRQFHRPLTFFEFHLLLLPNPLSFAYFSVFCILPDSDFFLRNPFCNSLQLAPPFLIFKNTTFLY